MRLEMKWVNDLKKVEEKQNDSFFTGSFSLSQKQSVKMDGWCLLKIIINIKD